MFPFRFCFGVALRLIAYLFLPFLSPYFCPPPLSHSFCRPHVSKEAKSPVCGATLNKLLQQQQQQQQLHSTSHVLFTASPLLYSNVTRYSLTERSLLCTTPCYHVRLFPTIFYCFHSLSCNWATPPVWFCEFK